MDNEEEVFEGTIMLRGVLGLRACWLAWARGPQSQGTGGSAQAPTQHLVQPPAFLGGYRDHVPGNVAACLFCLRCGLLPRSSREGFSLSLDGSCSAQLGIIPARVAIGISTLTLRHSVCLAGNAQSELWRALIAHCSAAALVLGSDALETADSSLAMPGWVLADGLGAERRVALGCGDPEPDGSPDGHWLRPPCGVRVRGSYGALSRGRSRTPKGFTVGSLGTAAGAGQLRSEARARFLGAFGRGELMPPLVAVADEGPLPHMGGPGQAAGGGHGFQALHGAVLCMPMGGRQGCGGGVSAAAVSLAPPGSGAGDRMPNPACLGAGGPAPRTRSPALVVAGYAWPSRVARLGVAQSSPVVDVLVHSLWLLGMEGMACRCPSRSPLLATVPVEVVPMSI